jgi:hypothetical protein
MIQTILRAALLAAGMAGAALAGPISLTFSGPGTGVAGTSVTLVATAENTSGVEQTLDGISFTLISPFVDFDDSVFFIDWPLSLDASGPGALFGPAAMFDIVIPLGTSVGLYTGSIVNLYGGGGTLLLASESFEIDVVPEGVPEPATVYLLAGGIAAMALVGRVRRKAVRTEPQFPV